MLWRAFLFLGLRFFPLSSLFLVASTAFLVRKVSNQ
jgi:nitrate reductase NapE component